MCMVEISLSRLGCEKPDLIQDDFELAIRDLVPSVSEQELSRYEKIKSEFSKGKQVTKEVEIEGELELDGKVKEKLIFD